MRATTLQSTQWRIRWLRAGLGASATGFALMCALDATADEADDLFSKGQKAFEETRYADAERNFEAAFEKRQSADIAANLAQAEIELGKKSEAANHLVYALRFLPASAPDGVKVEMRAALDKLALDLGRVTITVNVDGASVRVAGRVVGTSPLADPIYVDAGLVEASAALAGHDPGAATGNVERGRDLPLSLNLKVPGVVPDEKPIWPAVLLGTAGGAFMLGGAGLLAGAFVTRSDAEERAADGLCVNEAPICDQVGSDLDAANTLGVAGFVGLGLGVASVAGMVMYLAWPSDAPKGAELNLRFGVGGLTLEGSF